MATITEDYVSFEIAKLLKAKGFDEKCRYVWILDKANDPKDNDGVYKVSSPCFMEGESYVSNEDIDRVLKYYDGYYNKSAFLCPTLSIVMKWLREVHNIGIFPSTYTHIVDRKTIHSYGTAIINLKTYELMTDNYLSNDTYEDAVETAIKYCLENLI